MSSQQLYQENLRGSLKRLKPSAEKVIPGSQFYFELFNFKQGIAAHDSQGDLNILYTS